MSGLVSGVGLLGDSGPAFSVEKTVFMDPDNEGRPIREDTFSFGGCGKEAMLTLFLMPFSFAISVALATRASDLTVGTAGVDVACCKPRGKLGTGMVALEGVRSLDGVGGLEGDRKARLVDVTVPGPGRLFRVFESGIGGRAVVGGSCGESAGRGSVVAITQLPRQRAVGAANDEKCDSVPLNWSPFNSCQ